MKRNIKILRKKEVWEVANITVEDTFVEEVIQQDPYEWATDIEHTLSWGHDETTNSDIVIIDDVTPGDEQDIYEGEADFG